MEEMTVDNSNVPLLDPSSKVQEWVDPLWQDVKFRAKLKVYVTKNNVCWTLTDVFNQVICSKTGGNLTKRGYLKNSQKVAIKNFSQMFNVIKQLNIDYLYYELRHGFGNKKSLSTMKSVVQVIEGFKSNALIIHPVLINTTTRSISTIRLQGGRRGRR